MSNTQTGLKRKAGRANRVQASEGAQPGVGDDLAGDDGWLTACRRPRPSGSAAGQHAGGSRQARIRRVEDGALAKRQCSVIAALETAAHPHHTEANPEMVSRAMTTTAIRLTTPNSTTLR